MAATIYVAENWESKRARNPKELTIWLDGDGTYWFLYRYFEGANLDRGNELVDLYGGAQIDGYQLDRLEDEVKVALEDVSRKPDQWKVLTGWKGSRARENEIWSVVDKSTVAEVINRLLALIAFARSNHLKLIVSGD